VPALARWFAGAALVWVTGAASAQSDGLLVRGAWLLRAAVCVACHTDREHGGRLLAGGRALNTPFGTFYTPNITPDREHGIGAWNVAEFTRALRSGIGPDGGHYYPAFPYTTYTRMRDADIEALYRYLRTVPPAARANRAHQLPWPLRWRFANRVWQWLFFDAGAWSAEPARDATWNRGAYLVEALAHCGECHTPRNPLGAVDRGRWLAGNRHGPEGDAVPNITPDVDTGIGDWSRDEVVEYLASGLMPDGDTAGGAMAEVIDEGLAHLERADLEAIAAYLASVPAVRNQVASTAREPPANEY